MAYINDNRNVIRTTDLENQEVEVIWLEVCPFKSKHLYRLLVFTAHPHTPKLMIYLWRQIWNVCTC